MKVFVKALEQNGPKKYIRDAKQMEIDLEIAKVVKGALLRRTHVHN